MNIDLTHKEVGEIFQIPNDKRYFKVFAKAIVNDDMKNDKYGTRKKFYGYNMKPDAEKFLIDEATADYLAESFSILIISQKITTAVQDALYFTNLKINYLKDYYGYLKPLGVRYIAECKAIYQDKEYIRSASGSADNINSPFMSYSPEIAMIRAKKKMIIDLLELKDIIVDDIETMNYEVSEEAEKDKPQLIQEPITEAITEAQLSMVQKLVKSNKKKFLKKYKSITKKEAEDLINKLKKNLKAGD